MSLTHVEHERTSHPEREKVAESDEQTESEARPRFGIILVATRWGGDNSVVFGISGCLVTMGGWCWFRAIYW